MNFIGGAVMIKGAECGKQGGAMYDPPSHDPSLLPHGPHCWLMYAPPIIIDNSYMSIMRGFQQVNIAFNTWGGSTRATTIPMGLPGPVMA